MEEANSYINSFKRPRRYFICWKNTDESEENTDRISELHESLLIKIISLLNTEEAVKTSVLSKRWKNLWTHLDDLHFYCSMIFWHHFRPFLSFVDNVLTRCTSNNLKKFSIHASSRGDLRCNDDDATQRIDCWLERVFKKNVERLNIRINGFKYRPLKWFYQNSSLIDLEISYWKIKIPDDELVSWTSLKSLTLSHMSIKTERLEKILSGCPVLENLVLYQIKSMTDLCIESPSVRKVKIVPSEYYSKLDVDAPWIKELEISGGFHNTNLQLLHVSSLLNVKLTLKYSWDCLDDLFLKVATRLLKTVSRVEELTLGPAFIQAISLLILFGNPCPLLPFARCKHLTVQLSVAKYELPGIVCLLQNTPVLETLVVEVEYSSQDVFEKYLDEIYDFDEDHYLSTQKGDFPHLKTVEFARRENACGHEDVVGKNKKCHDYELVAYLSRNARSFKKLFVTAGRCICSMYCPFRYASLLSQKIESNHEFAEEWGLKIKHSSLEFTRRGSASETANSV